jgi:hypothetical protein
MPGDGLAGTGAPSELLLRSILKRTLEICLRAARLRFSATCRVSGRW